MTDPSVLLVCPQPVLRLGLRQLFSPERGVALCAEATRDTEALDLLARYDPAVVMVVAISGASEGVGLVKDIHRLRPTVPILVLGRARDSEHLNRVLRAGARGYATCMDELPDLLIAVASIRCGSLHLSRDASEGLQLPLSPLSPVDPPAAGVDLKVLSDREMEVFQRVGRRLTSKQIAQELCISVKTVETHRQRMKEKMRLLCGSELNQCAERWVGVGGG